MEDDPNMLKPLDVLRPQNKSRTFALEKSSGEGGAHQKNIQKIENYGICHFSGDFSCRTVLKVLLLYRGFTFGLQ